MPEERNPLSKGLDTLATGDLLHLMHEEDLTADHAVGMALKEIKRAVEDLFKVKVLNVNTINMRGKEKRMGRFMGRRPDWKKAIITLKDGDKIEYFEGA